MKTFDLATLYVDTLDLKNFELFTKGKTQQVISDAAIKRYKEFNNDKRATKNNEQYRQDVFECALFNHAMIQQGLKPFWPDLINIVKQNRNFNPFKRVKKRGAYLEEMWHQWDLYCERLEQQPYCLIPGSELAGGFFMCAYHYVCTPFSA